MKNVFKWWLVLMLATMLPACATENSGSALPNSTYKIGVYYFPGWKNKQLGAPSDYPWLPITKFPDRKPLLGWYDESNDDVMRQQLDWMHSYGIDYVVFDWYFGSDNKAYLEHALAAYLRAPNRDRVKFSILWSNHGKALKSKAHWESMVKYWVKYYFPRPEFFRLDEKPVVYIFYADYLKQQAASFGISTKELFDNAQELARAAGFPGINFVAGTGASTPMINSYAKAAGYEAFSAYNFHRGPNDLLPSHSYEELDKGYRGHWKRFAEVGNLPLIVPMTSGWDKRPWGGSKDPWHDNSLAKPVEFRKHLEAAKAFIDSNPTITRGMGVICCWNEYGEGSFIEPTENMGFSFLEQVRDVFGNPAQ
ncbi:MAG: glycoside hydrolase family 99-like domain-containing protein [Thiobacillus sp.]|nr:glycoside hydrolase family 99-like domain-containing protein [Thiobacillus sp.]